MLWKDSIEDLVAVAVAVVVAVAVTVVVVAAVQSKSINLAIQELKEGHILKKNNVPLDILVQVYKLLYL